jgi:hypothetical protein
MGVTKYDDPPWFMRMYALEIEHSLSIDGPDLPTILVAIFHSYVE